MPKIRKLKRKKVYRYDLNRKRLRDKQNKLPKIQCEQLKEAWDKGRSVKTNLADMGLAYDPNKSLKIPSIKSILTPADPTTEGCESSDVDVAEKQQVVAALEEESRKPRPHVFRLPNNEVQWATYLMDKYGEDYKAMAKDRRNDYQDTWRQIRAKIKRFKGIPEQYGEYLKSQASKAS